MPTRAAIDRFLAERRIGFVGASRNPKQFANSVYRAFRDGGYDVVPVNPNATEIEGDPAYSSVTAVPGPLDAVFVILPAAAVDAVVDECIARGVKRVWLHRGGSSSVTEHAVAACRAAGVEVVDGACPLMFLEPVRNVHRLHRFFAKRRLAA